MMFVEDVRIRSNDPISDPWNTQVIFVRVVIGSLSVTYKTYEALAVPFNELIDTHVVLK